MKLQLHISSLIKLSFWVYYFLPKTLMYIQTLVIRKVVSWVLIHMLLLFLMLLFFVVYMLFFSKCAAKFSTATAALPGCVDSP